MAEPRRTDKDSDRDNQAGFTLTEMMVALGILMFGLTAVAGSMIQGSGERRGSEMRFRATHMVDRVFHDIRQHPLMQEKLDDELPDGLPIVTDVSGYPGLKYKVKFLTDPDDAKVVLVRVWISWKEQGELVAERFDRVMIREAPFSTRISRLKERGSR